MATFLAHAKINLFLRIVRRREDGYHDIETLFQKIDLADRLTISHGNGEGFVLECSGEGVGDVAMTREGMERNLVTRALREMEKHLGRSIGETRIVLDKHVPAGGGLGGGSSDAAAMLLALNEDLGLGVSGEDLHSIATRLGSDVPFFLGPPTAIGTGRGEILTPVTHASGFWAVLALPAMHVSTPAVYARYNPAAPSHVGDLPGLLRALTNNDLDATLALLFNEMEALAFGLVPTLGDLRARLEDIAVRPVRMSGSGSTLFTLAATGEDARSIAEQWHERESVLTTSVPFIV